MIKAITGGYINIHPSTFRMSRPNDFVKIS